MALQDERNFRSAYYEKVGSRSVEEKKSLEMLLKDKPLDVTKLKQFCLRFSVPSVYRNLVWSLSLDVLPHCLDTHNFILEQRTEEYNELLRALKVLRLIDNSTPKDQVFLALFMLQTSDYEANLGSRKNIKFISLVQAFSQFFENEIDIYWLSKYFFDHTEVYNADSNKLIECMWTLLEKEDITLYNHVQKHNLIDSNCLERWFDMGFAGVICDTALAKIWDKICGGSFKILPFIVVGLMTNYRHKLLKLSDPTLVMESLCSVPEDVAEIVVNKAIELWQQYGSPLTVNDKLKLQ